MTIYSSRRGNITYKRRYDRGDGVSYYHHRLYNTENKMVQVLTINGSTVTRQSDQFYHLDGSRLWEGIMDENNTVIEGEMRFNDFVSVRLTSDGLSYLVLNIYANGRRLSQGELAIWDSEWGCNLSPAGKLRFVTFSTLAVNFGLLILPVFLAILIRGLFFDKSWRNRRTRNTFILLLVVIFTLEINPIPNLNLGAAKAAQSEIRLWFMAHVRDRLNRMYGDADRVPLMDHRLTVIGHPDLVPPSSGEAPLRGAMLYFLPPELKKRVEGVWPTSAKADIGSGSDAIEKVWHTTAKADLRRGAELGGTGFGGTDMGGTDIPVGQTTSNLKPQTSNLDFSGASDVSRDGLSDSFMSALASAFLPSEAKAWSGGAAELDRLHFFHTDHLGSTRIVTDCAGALFERIDYLPFGEIFRDDVSSGPDTNYDRHRNKFTGQTWDYLTGLYFYNARYYDPEMGRFSQADTMVPKPLDSQQYNRYSYVNNNPYKYTDPSGHFGFLAMFIMAVVDAAISAVATAALVAIAAYMITGAIMSAITGRNYISGEGIGGAAGGGVLSLIPGVGEIMMAISLVQFAVACHNGQGGEAMLGLVCGLVGNIICSKAFSNQQADADTAQASSAEKLKVWSESRGKKPDAGQMKIVMGQLDKMINNGGWQSIVGNFIKTNIQNGHIKIWIYEGDIRTAGQFNATDNSITFNVKSFLDFNAADTIFTVNEAIFVEEFAHAWQFNTHFWDFMTSDAEIFAEAMVIKYKADTRFRDPYSSYDVLFRNTSIQRDRTASEMLQYGRETYPSGVGLFERYFGVKY